MATKILAVDDSQTMRDMISFTLKNEGFDVITAVDGKDAVGTLSDQTVDLVITDINMPNMDGIELVRTLRTDARFKATPILILTTESGDAKKQEGKAAGATGWIVKPFVPEKLVQVVKKVCP